MLILLIVKFQNVRHIWVFKIFVGSNLVNFGVLLLLFGNAYKFERRLYFLFLKIKLNLYICLRFQSNFRENKKDYSSSYNFSSPKRLSFLLLNWSSKIIIYNLKIQWSIFSTIDFIHTRQNSLYFCTIKIINLKHVYMPKKYQSLMTRWKPLLSRRC